MEILTLERVGITYEDLVAASAKNGRVPSEDMAAINSILDSGITFWHTGAVGNYSANNSII